MTNNKEISNHRNTAIIVGVLFIIGNEKWRIIIKHYFGCGVCPYQLSLFGSLNKE